MPNWCRNFKTVHGPEQDVTDFEVRARGRDQQYGGPGEPEVEELNADCASTRWSRCPRG